jgi:hypothetical protein
MGGYASTFDQYGDWRYQQDYGYVWYPRVANDWRPYYYGRWASYPSYGWTWITADPFGYPTHHYGRWGVSAGVWFWVPSHHWGPAYVSWGYAPNYVSWCPLGFNNHAVFSLDLYNVGPAYYAGHYNGHYYSAWTTVPHGYFGHGYVHQHAVNFDRGYTGARPHFSQSSGPARGIAVQRRSTDANGVPGPVDGRGTATPVRFAGTRTGPAAPVSASPSAAATRNGEAVARGRAEAPRFVNRGNDIVRSQTAPAVAPRDNAVSRTTPGAQAGSSAAQRQRYAWDNPAYRPPAAGDPNGVAPRGIDRAVPRTEAPSAPAYAPNYGAGRSYTRPNMDTPRAPSGAAVPNQMSQPQRPAYQPPSSGRGYGPAPSRAEGLAPSRVEGPAPSRVEGAGRPSGGSERAAPAAPRAGSGNGGGDHAVPRTGGGAPAQAAPSRGESRGGSQPRGGRGR